ncbi:MAG TPA: hypothetical protein VFT66_08915 [Roseiflexaceae bacterium]|jgi:hypothetical protein|nr:hypothetical protein [Roseiflexaceae bacterium]
MSDEGEASQRLMRMLHDVEMQYDTLKNDLSVPEMIAFWSALWRLSEKVVADRRQIKIANRKRQRTG